MNRHAKMGWGRIIPVLLFAVLALVYAPALSSLAQARMAADPDGLSPICQTFGQTNPGQTSPGEEAPQKAPAPHVHHDCCTLCGFPQFDAPAQAVVEPAATPSASRKANWIARADRLTYNAQRARAKARAPPQNS